MALSHSYDGSRCNTLHCSGKMKRPHTKSQARSARVKCTTYVHLYYTFTRLISNFSRREVEIGSAFVSRHSYACTTRKGRRTSFRPPLSSRMCEFFRSAFRTSAEIASNRQPSLIQPSGFVSNAITVTFNSEYRETRYINFLIFFRSWNYFFRFIAFRFSTCLEPRIFVFFCESRRLSRVAAQYPSRSYITRLPVKPLRSLVFPGRLSMLRSTGRAVSFFGRS